jgi:hypothetical protein
VRAVDGPVIQRNRFQLDQRGVPAKRAVASSTVFENLTSTSHPSEARCSTFRAGVPRGPVPSSCLSSSSE